MGKNGPWSLTEALKTKEAHKWQTASDEEIAQLIKAGTWTLTDLPISRQAIGNCWVFIKKYDASGNLERYKARLVAQGFSQIFGTDFYPTYTPTLRLDSQHAVLTLPAIQRRILRQLDVKDAYPNGELQEEIYMCQPEGYNNGSGRVCRLHKTLYGLKQAGRAWNTKFNGEIISLGFTRTTSDPCVYTRNGLD